MSGSQRVATENMATPPWKHLFQFSFLDNSSNQAVGFIVRTLHNSSFSVLMFSPIGKECRIFIRVCFEDQQNSYKFAKTVTSTTRQVSPLPPHICNSVVFLTYFKMSKRPTIVLQRSWWDCTFIFVTSSCRVSWRLCQKSQVIVNTSYDTAEMS
jgi:hypothetical protein